MSWENKITAAAAADATQAVQGLPFTDYNEDFCSGVKANIEPNSLVETVKDIAREKNIPNGIRDENLLLCNTPNTFVINEFKFNTNSDPMFVFGRVVLVKQPNGCSDIAYSMCMLNYKLSPNAIQTNKMDVRKFIDFTTNTHIFPCHAQQLTYFRHRIVDHFSEKYKEDEAVLLRACTSYY